MPSAQSALRATGVVELRSGEYRLHLNILEFLILVQLDFYPCILLNEKSPAPNKMYHCGDLIAWLVIAMFNIVGREIFVDFRKWCSGGGQICRYPLVVLLKGEPVIEPLCPKKQN